MDEEMRQITKVVLHCSYSEWGSEETIRKWHTEPPPEGYGWSDNGYHFVILNQFPTFSVFKERAQAVAAIDGKLFNDRLYSTQTDGQIIRGRPLSKIGSHTKSYNSNSIGICYIGISPTPAQNNAMLYLCTDLIKTYPLLTVNDIHGHNEFNDKKTCPNFYMPTFRKALTYYMR
jgi:hypothetical protein